MNINCKDCANKNICDNYQAHKDAKGNYQKEDCGKFKEINPVLKDVGKTRIYKKKDADTIEVINVTPSINFSKPTKLLFDVAIGNPPYQGDNHQQLYPFFYIAGKELANNVNMIFPTGWQEPKTANNLGKLNTKEVKEDKQIVSIYNKHNAFPGVPGAEWTNVVLWKRGHNNGLNGQQKIITNGQEEIKTLITEKSDIPKPAEILALRDLVLSFPSFSPLSIQTSVRKPYGLRTDFLDDPEKYGLPNTISDIKTENSIAIYGMKNRKQVKLFLDLDYPIPKKTCAIKQYKVFVPYAWGNMNDKTGLGGAFSDIIIAAPNEICTETYQESGCYQNYDLAKKHAKYLMTKFARACLYVNKTSQHSTTAYGAVPIQDYSEHWWDESIAEIDEHLFEKYNVPENIRKFVRNNIQARTEINIINFKD